MDEIKAWKCEQGHTLGQIIRNGRGVTRLLLYREAVDFTQEDSPQRHGERGEEEDAGKDRKAEEVDVMAVIEGYAADIRCSKCGSIRSWIPGAEALRKMLI